MGRLQLGGPLVVVLLVRLALVAAIRTTESSLSGLVGLLYFFSAFKDIFPLVWKHTSSVELSWVVINRVVCLLVQLLKCSLLELVSQLRIECFELLLILDSSPFDPTEGYFLVLVHIS
jgi:hypothetical protein